MASDKGRFHPNATHIALFLDWAFSRGLVDVGKLGAPRWQVCLRRVGLMSTASFLSWAMDDVFDSKQQLTDEGHRFAEERYDRYVTEYQRLFSDHPKHEVPYTSATRRRVAELLDGWWSEWRATRSPPPEARR